jgi:predicted  nucleic acid-binding Zn-ribbon protein
MSRIKNLYDLQLIDTKIDNLNASQASMEKALTESVTLDDAKQKFAAAETVLVAARSELKESEATAQKQEAHADDLEKKLYGGAIKGQKEMAAAQHEIETFRQRKKETDDKIVDLMLQTEAAEDALKEAKEVLVKAEADQAKATVVFRDELSRVQTELENLKVERDKRLKLVMAADVPIYERLRQSKQGAAVSELILGKTCSKCRVELPVAKQREVKSGMTMINCSSCGRILYYKII